MLLRTSHYILIGILVTSLLAQKIFAIDSLLCKGTCAMYLIPGMSDFEHPVTTSQPEAQKFFNQGLIFKYGFNNDASYLSFQKAAEIDPEMAMAYWGMALALGPNINSPLKAENQIKAYENIQKAIKLSDRITANEKAYIQALSLRYAKDVNANQKTQEMAYKNAMKDVTNIYLDDADARTLYAESILILDPWHYWTPEGKPIGSILEAIEALESVLIRMPNHLGANHFYIHAIEGSKHPERGLMSARRLSKILPASGHFLHMASHIYLLVGDYHRAVEVNEDAVKADKNYIRDFGMAGSYPIEYLSHNYSFLVRAYSLEGQYEKALQTAQALQAFYVPHFVERPDLEEFAMAPQWTFLRFNRWTEIIKLKPFAEEMKLSNLLLNFAKAYAYASDKKPEEAIKHRQLFQDGVQEFNITKNEQETRKNLMIEIAEKMLQAKFAYVENKVPETIQLLKEAISLQDSLQYNSALDWYYSIRESLGALLLQNRMHQQAEKIFRENLKTYPKNGRTLFGLLATLKAQQKDTDAYWVQKELDEAWQYSSTPLTLDQLF